MVDKTDGHLNAYRGERFELDCVKYLLDIGYSNIGTSRNWSEYYKDKQGIDICSWDDELYGKLPYNIDCKASSNIVNYPKLLDRLPKDEAMNVVFHRNYYNGQVRAEVAILGLQDFLGLIRV